MIVKGFHYSWKIGCIVLLSLVMPVLIGLPILADMYWPGETKDTVSAFPHWLFYVFMFAIVGTLKIIKYRRTATGIKHSHISIRAVMWSLLLGMLLFAVSMIILFLSKKYSVFYSPEDTSARSSNVPLLRGNLRLLTYVAASVGSPILEELGFRGIIVAEFERMTRSTAFAIFASAVFFTIGHLTGLIDSIGLFMMAISNSVLDEKYHSLMPGIIVHVTYNTIVSYGTLLFI